MDKFLKVLEECQNWKQLMRSSCKQNNLNTIMALDLTILKLKNFNDKFNKSIVSLGSKIKTIWVENELRAFNWILIALSGLQKVRIEDFGENEWQIMQDIFYGKELLFLKFEGRRLSDKKKKKNKSWDIEQQRLLGKYASQYCSQSRKAWNEVALKMFQVSNCCIFREGKHCREHWLNYLDPTKNRGKWSTQQDILLVQRVNKTGKKWSQFALLLNRTEHSVKNRYNSLIVKQQKASPSIKRQNKLINELLKRLKTSASEQQIEQSEQIEFCNSEQLLQQDQAVSCKQEKMEQGQKKGVKAQIMKEQDEQEKREAEKKAEMQKNVESFANNSNNNNLCAAFDFGNYIRQDNNNEKYGEYPILSPFIYSPSPTNYLNSPVFMIKQPNRYNTFECMFSLWAPHISNPMEQSMHNKDSKNNQ